MSFWPSDWVRNQLADLLARLESQILIFASFVLLIMISATFSMPEVWWLPILIVLVALIAMCLYVVLEIKKLKKASDELGEKLPTAITPYKGDALLEITGSFLPQGYRYRANIMLPNPDGTYSMSFRCNYSPTDQEPRMILQPGEGCTGRAVAYEKQVFAEFGDALWALREENHALLNPELRWVLSTPIIRLADGQGEVLGVYNIDGLQDADPKVVKELLPRALAHAKVLEMIFDWAG